MNDNENVVPVTSVPVANESLTVQEPKKKKSKAPLIICLVLLLLIVICAVVFVVFNKPAKKDETTTTDKQKVFSYRIKGNGLDDFDLYFLQVENAKKNMVYSPLSIKYALAMLNEGTDGESHEQISSVIGDYQPKRYNNNEHMSFANAMFIRNTFKDSIQDNYINTVKEKYNAEVVIDSFETPKTMNDWVSNRTFGLIGEMVDENSVKELNFILTNALAIDMYWKNQIHCAYPSRDRVPCYTDEFNTYGIYNVWFRHEKLKGDEYEYHKVSYPYQRDSEFKKMEFNGKEGYKGATVLTVYNRYDIVKELGEEKIREEVGKAYKEWLEDPKREQWELNSAEKDVDKYLDQYIAEINENYNKEQKSTDYSIYVDDKVKVFAKDLQEYDGMALQYVGIMPVKDTLSDYIDKLKADEIGTIINNLKEVKKENFKEGVVTEIEGVIPIFKYDYELNMKDDLMKIGITDIFDANKSNLSKLVKNEKQVIVSSHKATIDFSNEGIKASAISSDGGAGSSSGGFNYLFEVPVERIDITFDKPYMYLIRDKATGEIWFVGSVYEPTLHPSTQKTS